MLPSPSPPQRPSLSQRWQRLIRRLLWRMDIHPSVWIAPTALIDRTWPRGIHIAEGCIIHEEAVVLTHDMTRGLYLDTRIVPRTRIGARAIIQPGAIVNRDMPDGHVAIGNPATISPR